MISRFTRVLLIAINVVGVLIGLGAIVGGFVITDWKTRYLMCNQLAINGRCYNFILIGGVVLLISLLGLVASFKASRSLLIAYAALLAFLVVLTAVGTVITELIGTQSDGEQYEVSLGREVLRYNPYDLQSSSTQSWNNIMSQSSCCGTLKFVIRDGIVSRNYTKPWQVWRSCPFMSRIPHSINQTVLPRNCVKCNQVECENRGVVLIDNDKDGDVYQKDCFDSIQEFEGTVHMITFISNIASLVVLLLTFLFATQC